MFTCAHTRQWSLADGRKKCAACRRVLPADHRKWGPGNLSIEYKKWLLEMFMRDESAYWSYKNLGISRPTAERFFRKLRERCAQSCGTPEISIREFSYDPEIFKNPFSSATSSDNLSIRLFTAFGIRYKRTTKNIEIFDLTDKQLHHAGIQAAADIAKGGPGILRLSPPSMDAFDCAYLELHRNNKAASVPRRRDLSIVVQSAPQSGKSTRTQIFWQFASEKLSLHRMIPTKYLRLYMAEMAWKFNHRELGIKKGIKALMATADKGR